jgi:hypothetical protein
MKVKKGAIGQGQVGEEDRGNRPKAMNATLSSVLLLPESNIDFPFSTWKRRGEGRGWMRIKPNVAYSRYLSTIKKERISAIKRGGREGGGSF